MKKLIIAICVMLLSAAAFATENVYNLDNGQTVIIKEVKQTLLLQLIPGLRQAQ